MKKQGSVLDWFKKMFGPGGSHSQTPYFYGKPELLNPLIQAIYNNSIYLDSDITEALVKYVQSKGGSKFALKFEDIVQYRANDIENLFENFFEEYGIDYEGDELIHHFVEGVLSDMKASYEKEFPEVQEAPKPQETPQGPVQPETIQQDIPQTQPSANPTITTPMMMDILEAIKSATPLLPKGKNINEVHDAIMPLLLKRRQYKLASAEKLNEMLNEAEAVLNEFLATEEKPEEWRSFIKFIMNDLTRKWSSGLGVHVHQPIGTMQGVSESPKTHNPLLPKGKTIIVPDANTLESTNPAPVNPVVPKQEPAKRAPNIKLRTRTYEGYHQNE